MTPLSLSWGLLNAAMLAGLAAALVPLVIHLWNRRRDDMVDWGAMQFLDLGERTRRALRLTEWLLLLARMALLGLVALALARPYWSASRATAAGTVAGAAANGEAPRRDVVLVLDGSSSMDLKRGGSTPRDRAVQWARDFVARLRPGDSAALVVATDRVVAAVDPPSVDRARILAALDRAGAPAGRAASNLPAALGEAFRILERTGNPARTVIVLTDGQRFAWRPGETTRWALLRELYRGLPVPPRLWSLAFGASDAADASGNGSVGPVSVSRGLITPGLPLTVSATVANAGPGPLVGRTAELEVDGVPVPGSAQAVGPVPAGGQVPLSFRTALANAGSHLVRVRLDGGDALAADDASALAVEAVASLRVLLIDGEPALEPLSGETDFLRAALAPRGDDAPQVEAEVVPVSALSAESLTGRRVAVLANIARLAPDQEAAVEHFLSAGGGLLVAPGDQTDVAFFDRQAWLPARLGSEKGDVRARAVVAHPAPDSFTGAAMSPLGRGEPPALAAADFFAYRVLGPAPGTSVTARLDTGDPWVVDRSAPRVMLLAAAIDAEAGTLPVNPDFVPLVHEWIFALAGGRAPTPLQPGEPWIIELDPPPATTAATLTLHAPGGATMTLPVVRAERSARVRVDDTRVPGVYRLDLPGGANRFAVVAHDGRESDLRPLTTAEMQTLAQGWPLAFETDPAHATSRLLAAGPDARHEAWRALVLAALGLLCFEIYLTRRLARG